mmetsp:Transcript_25630/g.39439  ORF Transcript_25630/g.39439 Transcript_25630/m.39439 type:complete len:213 (+) Transcript_25630:42-680(+)
MELHVIILDYHLRNRNGSKNLKRSENEAAREPRALGDLHSVVLEQHLHSPDRHQHVSDACSESHDWVRQRTNNQVENHSWIGLLQLGISHSGAGHAVPLSIGQAVRVHTGPGSDFGEASLQVNVRAKRLLLLVVLVDGLGGLVEEGEFVLRFEVLHEGVLAHDLLLPGHHVGAGLLLEVPNSRSDQEDHGEVLTDLESLSAASWVFERDEPR